MRYVFEERLDGERGKERPSGGVKKIEIKVQEDKAKMKISDVASKNIQG